jgi:hypothetical protein
MNRVETDQTTRAVKESLVTFQLVGESHSPSPQQRLVSRGIDPSRSTGSSRLLRYELFPSPDRWNRRSSLASSTHSALPGSSSARPRARLYLCDCASPPRAIASSSPRELYHHAPPLIEQGLGERRREGERGQENASCCLCASADPRWLRTPAGKRSRGRRASSLFSPPCSPGSSARPRPRTRTRTKRCPRATTTLPRLPLRSITITTEVSPTDPSFFLVALSFDFVLICSGLLGGGGASCWEFSLTL